MKKVKMKKELLKYVICPDCRNKLELIEYDDDASQGLLSCAGGHYYPIFNGVPVIIRNEMLLEFLGADEVSKFLNLCRSLKIKFIEARPLSQEIMLLRKASINWSTEWDTYKMDGTIWELKKTFLGHIPVNMKDLNNYKTVLEIGCGNGRDIQHVSGDSRLIFGIDISKSVYYAHKRFEKQGSIFTIRCDVNNLPFSDSFFDFIYSDHVLHHIYNLKSCFNEIKRVARNDNAFICNFYSKEDNIIMTKVIEPFKEHVLKKIPNWMIHIISVLPALSLWLTIKLIYLPCHKYLKDFYKLLPLSEHMAFWFEFNYKYLKLVCFDLLHAPIAYYFSSYDIDQLCLDTSLDLEEKYRLRQTLWICKGKFRK